jgi:hypothetical protein
MRNLINELGVTNAYARAIEISKRRQDFWAQSPLAVVASLSSRSKGSILEGIATELCQITYNLVVKAPANTDVDRIISGIPTEIKSSMCWDQVPGKWAWEQIRRFQEYERIIFLGANPDALYLWWCTKRDLDYHLFPFNNRIQHGGKKGNQQMYWIQTKTIDELPSYFQSMESWNEKQGD